MASLGFKDHFLESHMKIFKIKSSQLAIRPLQAFTEALLHSKAAVFILPLNRNLTATL